MAIFRHKYSSRIGVGLAPRSHTHLEEAIGEAEEKFNFKFRYTKDWDVIAITKQSCDNIKEHAPNLCFHYLIEFHYEN